MSVQEVIAVVKKALPNAVFGEDTDLIEEHILDSLAMIRLVVAIEKEFDIKITPKDMTPVHFRTVGALTALLEKLDEE